MFSNEFETALQYFCQQTGILHYCKEPVELSQIVIQDPRHLFSMVNQLVESVKCIEDLTKDIFKRL